MDILDKNFKKLQKESAVIQTYTERFAKGDLSIYISEGETDEFKSIAEHINLASGMLNVYIRDISGVLARISAGDLTIKLPDEHSYKGDFIPIRNALGKIVSTLNEIFNRINDMMGNVIHVCEKSQAEAYTVAENEEEQVECINALSKELGLVYEKLEGSTKHIGVVSDYIEKSKGEAEQGKEYVEQMLVSMQEVSVASNSIGKVVEMIQAISNKTKLLALNASIEAARAGDAGRGFAVVANEIGTLAAQTTTAVENTTQLVNNSIEKVKESENIVELTSNSFRHISESIDIIRNESQKIVTDNEYQTSSIKRMVELVDGISERVEKNAVFAKESVDSNEAMLKDIQELKSMISYFILEGQINTAVINKTEVENAAKDYLHFVESNIKSLSELDFVLKQDLSAHHIVECAYVLDEKGIQISKTIMNEGNSRTGSINFIPAKPGDDQSTKKYFMEGLRLQGGLYESYEYISAATGSLCKTFTRLVELASSDRIIICVDVKCMIG